MIAALRIGTRIPAGTIRRAVMAGTAWGVAMGLGLSAMAFADCGTICLSDVAFTTALATGAGIVTIGPLAAFRRPSRNDGMVHEPA